MIHKTVFAAGFLLVLTACDAPAPSRADIVRSLPETTLSAGFAEFEAVCFNGKTDDPNDAFLFEVDRRADGKIVCAMRARAPKNVDVFQTLRAQFGPARSAGFGSIASVFENYPRGVLIHQSGIQNAAGAGTYQLGTVRD